MSLVKLTRLTSYLVTFKLNAAAAIQRKLDAILSDRVNVKDFGVSGIYTNDPTELASIKTKLLAADDFCYQNGKTLYFPEGQYCITGSFTKKARWHCSGMPILAPFPQRDDDKEYLRPGYKHKMPGTSFFLMGGSVDSVTTQRSDMFSTIEYGIRCSPQYSTAITGGFGVIQDMDVLDAAGNLTTPSTDNRANGYGVGLLLDDNSNSRFPDMCVFGYFTKAGTCIWSHGLGDNPDYNRFSNGSTMGHHGLALIANDTAAGNGPGLSGSQFSQFQLFANDHHSRLPQPATYAHPYGHCLLIDGKTAAVDANANGHYFVQGGMRTYSNEPVVLDNCSNLHFSCVPYEFSVLSGQPQTGNQKFIGTTNTNNVTVMYSRNAPYTLFAHADFGDKVSRLTFWDQTTGSMVVGDLGAYVAIRPTGSAGGPRLHFTRSPSSTVTGTSIVMDTTDGDKIKIKSGPTTVATINGDTLEVTKLKPQVISYPRVTRTLVSDTLNIPTEVTYVLVAGEGAVADNLVTIGGTPEIGQELTIGIASSTQPITIKRTGNIRTHDNLDILLDTGFKQVTLMWTGAFWIKKSL